MPIRGKADNALIAGISYQQIAFQVNCNTTRAKERVGIAQLAVGRVEDAPFTQETPCRVKDLNPAIPGIGNVDLPSLINRNPPRFVELPIAQR